MRNINCVRCDEEMEFLGTEELQLGRTGWFLGDLPNLLAGSLEVEIYRCPKCKKIEFFGPGETVGTGTTMPGNAVTCSKCGKEYGTHLKECPHCGKPRF